MDPRRKSFYSAPDDSSVTPKRPRRVSTGRSSFKVDELKFLPDAQKKKGRGLLTRCPAYPVENYATSQTCTTLKDLLAEIIEHESASCQKVFSGDYAFVAELIAAVTQTIARHLSSIEPPVPKIVPHPTTQLRQRAVTTFETFLSKADEEIRRWESLQAVHADRESFAKSQAEEKKARRKHAESQLCHREIELSETLRTAYSSLAIKGDQLLRCLKTCKTRLTDTGKYISLVSDAVNQSVLEPYQALAGDAKPLIRALSA